MPSVQRPPWRAEGSPSREIGVRDFIFDLRPPGIALETAELLASEVLPRLADV